MEIKVREIRKVKVEKGSLRAMADIETAGLIIRGLKILDNGRGAWVSWPSQPWTGRDGAPHYTNVVEPASAEVRKAVTAAVLTAWADQGQRQTG